MAVFGLGMLTIGSLGAFNVVNGWTATALLPIWFVVVWLPGAWLQARAEGRPLSLVLRRATSRHPERWPGPTD